MSRCARLGALVLALAALATSGPESLQAQQTAEALRARLDSLSPLRTAAEVAAQERERRDLDARRRSAATVAAVDTLRVGLVTIITPVDQVDVARELFTEVWEEDFRNFEESPSLEEARFAFQWSANRVPIFIEANPRGVEFDSRWMTRRSSVEDDIRGAIGATLNYDLRRENLEIAKWLQGDPFRARAMEDVYRSIATTESRATRSCLEGNVTSCRSALGLSYERLRSPSRFRDPTVDEIAAFESGQVERLREWYTDDERRLLVTRLGQFRFRNGARGGRARWGACVEEHVTATCDQLLAEVWQDWAPMPGSVRESLLAHALEVGGEGAWTRLREDPTMSPSEALAYSAGMPLSELLEEWREAVVASRPDAYGDLIPKTALTLMWIFVFGVFAMRSERCRLG
jgi:hypothetical protein